MTNTKSEKEYHKNYYQKNREKLNAYKNNWKKENRDKVNKSQSGYRKRHKEKVNEWNRNYLRKLRKEVIKKYGNKCACCKENRFEFLAIDHTNGGGNEHRKIIGQGYAILFWIRKNNYPKGFRVLCNNCNGAFGHYGYCPHQNT